VDKNFRVILLGFSSNKGEYYIEKEFAELFKISHEKSKDMFRSVPTTIRKNITLEEAQKYERAIKKTGADCEVENMKFNISGLSLV
jgi:ribosomal protein L7/L12